jgi:hypothetical protein
MGCAPGLAIDHEEILRSETNVDAASSESNACSALVVWLAFHEDNVESLFDYYLPEVDVPELQFHDRVLMLSFTEGCQGAGNELIVDEVYLNDGILEVYETLIHADPYGPSSGYRPYNLSWLDLPSGDFAVEAYVDIDYRFETDSPE